MKKSVFFLILAVFSFAVYPEETQKSEKFYFFYSDSCPHCHEAMPFVEELEKEFGNIEFRKLELSQHPENLFVFSKKVEKCDDKGGVPTFIFTDKCIVGFKRGVSEEKIRAMILTATEPVGGKQDAPAVTDNKDKTGKNKTGTARSEKKKSGKKKNWRFKTRKEITGKK